MAQANPFFDVIDRTEYTSQDFLKSIAEPHPDLKNYDQSGKIVVVTGANAGIGLETARKIAEMNPARIILACRNAEKAGNAVEDIKKSTGFHNVEAWSLDLSSFESVKAFAKRFNESNLPLDILISNAGVGQFGSDYIETKHGLEVTIQVNHIANMLMILLLTPSISRAQNPRIVVLTSDSHFWANVDPKDPTPVSTAMKQRNGVTGTAFYPTSKLFNVLFVQEYARRAVTNAWICAANPGYTVSELGTKNVATGENTNVQMVFPGLPRRSTAHGATTSVYCATDVDVTKNTNGGYYSDVRESRKRSILSGPEGVEYAKKTWNDTIEILRKFVDASELAAWSDSQ